MKIYAFLLASLLHMPMAMSLAFANPKQFDHAMPIASRIDPPAADSTTHIFVRRDCLEPAEGSAYFFDLSAHRAPALMPGDPLPDQDCVPDDDEDNEN